MTTACNVWLSLHCSLKSSPASPPKGKSESKLQPTGSKTNRPLRPWNFTSFPALCLTGEKGIFSEWVLHFLNISIHLKLHHAAVGVLPVKVHLIFLYKKINKRNKLYSLIKVLKSELFGLSADIPEISPILLQINF